MLAGILKRKEKAPESVEEDYPIQFCRECGQRLIPYTPSTNGEYAWHLWLACPEYSKPYGFRHDLEITRISHEPRFNPKTGERNY